MAISQRTLYGIAGGLSNPPPAYPVSSPPSATGFLGGLFSGLSGTLGGFARYSNVTHEQERQQMMDMLYERRMRLAEAQLEEQRTYHQGLLHTKATTSVPDYTVPMSGPTETGAPARGLPPYLQGLPPAEIPMAAKAHAQSLFRPKPTQPMDVGAEMDEPTLRMTALNYAKGGGLPPLGWGTKGAEARMKIMNYAAHNFPTLDIAANKADLQKNTRALTDLQKLYDASTAFEGTAIANANVMETTLNSIPDTGTRFGNRVSRFLASQMGSPHVSAFYTALETVKPEFARLLSSPGATGGLLTDTSRREMSAVLSGDFTKQQLIHSVGILKRDAANRRKAYSNQIDAIRTRIAWNQFGANPNFNVGAQQPNSGASGDVYWKMDPSGKLVPASQ